MRKRSSQDPVLLIFDYLLITYGMMFGFITFRRLESAWNELSSSAQLLGMKSWSFLAAQDKQERASTWP